jgi:DNA-binding CsgD family transcriptional regulator
VTGWPLVGRGVELSRIIGTLRAERPRSVIVAGGLGVGKTRLAREAVAALDGEVAVEWLAASPASMIPFGALAHLLPDGLVDSPQDRLRLVRGVMASLTERAGGRPLLVAVDDAQWLDEGSAAVVHQLVVGGATRVVITLRSDEPAPEPVISCWKDGFAERLELQPLTPTDLDSLVSAALDRPVDRRTLDRLWSLTNGNPLFAHELVVGALETEAFDVNDGIWTWTGVFGPSTRLTMILESRLNRISAAGRAVLDTVAVGEPLDLDLLIDVCGADGVVEVERAGLVVVDDRQPDQLRLVHPLYGEALRAGMGITERRRIMGRLADAVGDSVATSPSELLRVATWRLESATPAPAWLFVEAAETANAVYDYGLAERLARRAVDDGGGLRASLALGDALIRQGRCVDGLAVLEPLAAVAESDDEHVRVAVARYFGLTTEYGFRAEFAEILLAAEGEVGDDNLRGLLRAYRAQLLCSAGHLDEGVALASITEGDEQDEIRELRTVTTIASAWLCAGKADSACELTERMLEPAIRRRRELPQAPGWVLSLHLPSLVVAGRLDDSEVATALAEKLISSAGAGASAPGSLALAKGMSALYRGRARTAVDLLQNSAAFLRVNARQSLPFALVQLTEAFALVGDPEGAAATSAEADELVAHHAIFEGFARRGRGWVALARGQRSTAIDLFLEAAEWAGSRGHHTAELFALHDAVRIGANGRAAHRLQAAATSSEGRWAPPIAARAAAILADDGAALVAAAECFEALGAMLWAAETNADASASFRRSGHRGQADRCAARAAMLARACEGSRTPVLDELERPLPITRREREVANLAADGLSSQAIAERLFLSVRTVEGHLQNAYAKLGVNQRRELAEVLRVNSVRMPNDRA